MAGLGLSRRRPSAASGKLGRWKMSVQPNAYKYALTTRERQVMRLVSKGLSNREVASRLNLTEGTFAQHISDACNQQSNRARSLGPFLVMVTRSHRGISWALKRSITECGLRERAEWRGTSPQVDECGRMSAAGRVKAHRTLTEHPGELYQTI